MQKEKKIQSLVDAIIDGIDRKKGLDIVKINLKPINHSEFDYFVICHGNSNTQVAAIANSVETTVKELIGEHTIRKNGHNNALWIALDYGNVMVHVFQHETRQFYKLEQLWEDAEIEHINTNIE